MLGWHDLWPQERAIAFAVQAGARLDGDDPDSRDQVDPKGLPVCRGAFIAQVLKGETVTEDGTCIVPKEPGVAISGYRIEGPINLIDERSARHHQELKPLLLENCDITHPIELSHAHIARLAIIRCRWKGLDAAGCKIKSSFEFTQSVPLPMEGESETTAVATINLHGARIDGPVNGSGAVLRLPEPNRATLLKPEQYHWALNLSESEIHGSFMVETVFVRENDLQAQQTAKRFFAIGGVSLDGATVAGDIWMTGAFIMARHRLSLSLQNARVRGCLGLSSIAAARFEAYGTIWILGAHIEGGLQMSGTQSSGALLVCPLDARKILGQRKLPPELIAYWEATRTYETDGTDWTSLEAGSARLGPLVLLRFGFEAWGHLKFHNADVRGNLELLGATVCGSILLDGATIDGMVIWDGLKLDGADLEEWAEGRIAAEAKAPSIGQRLRRISLETRRRHIREKYYSSEAPPLYRLSLRGARIGRSLNAETLVAPNGAIVDLRGCKVSVVADKSSQSWGRSSFDLDTADRHRAVVLRLDGFEYARFEYPETGERIDQRGSAQLSLEDFKIDRLAWLSRQFPMGLKPNRWSRKGWYRPWAYVHLAKVLRSAGDDADADKVEQARLVLKRNSQDPRFTYPFSLVFAYCFGSGFDPFRAFFTLLVSLGVGLLGVEKMQTDGVLVLNTVVVATMAQDVGEGPRAAIPIGRNKEYMEEIPCGNAINPLLYAADVFIPVVHLHQEERCEITNVDTVEPLFWRIAKGFYAFWGWIAVSLSIITFSGIVRARRADIEARG